MPTYIRLVRLTDEGRKAVKQGKSMTDEAARVFQENGGRIVSLWGTLGRYDFVGVVEAPDDMTMMKISALISSKGNVVAETLPAVPAQDFTKAVS